MLSFLALILFTSPNPPVPMGVNDSVLGKAEEFAFAGPGTVCADSFTYDLAANETAYLSYSGIHNFTLETAGPKGALVIALGGINLEPKGKKSFIFKAADKVVYRIREGGQRYLIYDRAAAEAEPNPYPGGPLIELKGSALNWDDADLPLISRLTLGQSKPELCDATYNYGWGVILDDEPLIVRKSESPK